MLVFILCCALWGAPIVLTLAYVPWPVVGVGAIVLYAIVSVAFALAYSQTYWMR